MSDDSRTISAHGNALDGVDLWEQRIQGKWPWLLAFCIAVFLAFTLAIDWERPLWNDELFTYYIAHQSSMSDVWKTLQTGAEQVPPLFYVIIRFFTSLLGFSNIGLRLPETLGALVMSTAAFVFVRRRTSPTYGLVAFLFPALTYAFFFSYEARPYGIVMGCCGGAVLCWQRATEGGRRGLALAGLALCLAAALGCHYYAILVFFPFALAECARVAISRRLDLSMYAALAFGTLSLPLCLPLLRAASGYSARFWSKPHWTNTISFYEMLLDGAGLALLLLLLLAALFIRLQDNACQEGRDPRGRVATHELVLMAGFTLIPVVAVALAKLVTGAFTPRYAIYSVMGIAVLLAFSLSELGRQRVGLGLACSIALLSCWSVVFVRQYQAITGNARDQAATFEFLQKTSASEPLIIAGPHSFFEMSHLANIRRAGNFLFLADVDKAIQYTQTDTVERGLLALQPIASLQIEDYRRYTLAHANFLVYDSESAFSWVLQDLIKSGHTISVYAAGPSGRVYRVGPPR